MSAKRTPSNRRSPGFLPEEVKRVIIMQCARWERPTAIARMVKQEFGIEVSPQSVEGYDPTKSVGRNLSRAHRESFYAEREKFKANIDAIPIANATYRIAKLQEYSQAAEDKGDLALAAAMHKQAAQDLGSVFTNHLNLTGTIAPQPVDLSHLTQEERDALRNLLDRTDPENGNGKLSPRLTTRTPRKTSSI